MRMFHKATVVIGASVITGGILAVSQLSSGGDVALLETPAWLGGLLEYVGAHDSP